MSEAQISALERILKRDRLIVLASLVAVAALAWIYLFTLASDMHMPASKSAMDSMPGMDMSGMDMAPKIAPWTATQFALMFAMWSIMMVGMMTPAVAPMVLLYARVGRSAAERGAVFAPTFWFALGYFIAWTVFSLIATTAQWALEQASLLTPMMALAAPKIGGAFLIAAALYQWSPLKNACLAQCCAPMRFVQNHGGFKPGFLHSVRLACCTGSTASVAAGF